MEQNVGKLDAGIRFILGFLFLLAGWFYYSFLAVLIGLILVATALFRVCLIYKIFGISTAEKTVKASKPVKAAKSSKKRKK